MRFARGAGGTVVAQVRDRLEVQQRVVADRRSRVEPGVAGVRRCAGDLRRIDVARLEPPRLVATGGELVRRRHHGRRGDLVLDAGLVVVEVGREHEHGAVVLADRDAASC